MSGGGLLANFADLFDSTSTPLTVYSPPVALQQSTPASDGDDDDATDNDDTSEPSDDESDSAAS